MQREIFDTAASVGQLLETAALRGQIARFLRKHKDGGRSQKGFAGGCASRRDIARRRSVAMGR